MPSQPFPGVGEKVLSKKHHDFVITAIITTVLLAIILLAADHLIADGKMEILGLFSLHGSSLKSALYVLCASLMVILVLVELNRFTTDVTRSFRDTVNIIINRVDHLGDQVREGVFRYGEVMYRVLRYDETHGVIYNRLDEKASSEVRNIVFDARTVNAVLLALKTLEAGQSTLESNHLLLGLGRAAGNNFGQRFIDHIQSSPPVAFKFDDLYDWVEYWTRYDTQAGFGRFLVGSRPEWSRSKAITLRHSFLTPTTASARLCDFMTGYIEGFLKRLPEDALQKYDLSGKHLTIVHPDDATHCAFHSRANERGCVFVLQGEKTQR
jgi:hypothetical protein